MKLTHVVLPAVLVAAGALVSARCSVEGPEVGKAPPEISAKAWLNHVGAEPSLASLRGQAVLLEFWATW